MKQALATLISMLCVWPAFAAGASGLQALEKFITTAKTGRAAFTQVVTSPPRQGQPARSKTSSGQFEFARPDRFRFDYQKPFEQTLVADGQTLWLYDADLNQVTARRQAQALGSTPAALIASASDMAALRRDFALQAAPDADGLQWVQATPKLKDGQLERFRVGFRGDALAAMEILDGFGQRSVLTFKNIQINPALSATAFRFTPPADAEVVRP